MKVLLKNQEDKRTQKKKVQGIAKQNLKCILRRIKGKIELYKRQIDNKKELLEIKIKLTQFLNSGKMVTMKNYR